MSIELLQKALGYEPLHIPLADVELTVFGQVDSTVPPSEHSPGVKVQLYAYPYSV